jgi:hypothetical protein
MTAAAISNAKKIGNITGGTSDSRRLNLWASDMRPPSLIEAGAQRSPVTDDSRGSAVIPAM